MDDKTLEEHSWKCDRHVIPPFQKSASIPVLHNTLPAPNNNVAITLNHTVLPQPPWGKVWNWNESEFIFIPLCVDGQKTTYLAYICLPLKKKKTLPYISASHLVCIGETMQLTPVCQWRFWRVTASRMRERLNFFFFLSSSVLVFAGKCLDGRGKTGVRVRKEKANLESTSWQSASWSLKQFEVVNSMERGEECETS